MSGYIGKVIKPVIARFSKFGQQLMEAASVAEQRQLLEVNSVNEADSKYLLKNLPSGDNAELLNEIKKVDGSGSGIDADKLDGLDSSVFARINGDNTKTFKIADAVNGDEAVSKGQLLAHYPTLTYVEYTTGTSVMSIAQPAANTWFDLPNVTITIPEDGIYAVTYGARMWQDASTSAFWKQHRVINNGAEITKSILLALDRNVLSISGDSTFSKTFVDSFVSLDVLQIQGYWGHNTSGNTNYSDPNGSTSIVAIKIG